MSRDDIDPADIDPADIDEAEEREVQDDLDTALAAVVRADCVDGERPCPYAGCRHHLAIEVHPNTGTIKLAFPDLEIDEMPETCSLDVADRGAHQLDVIGALMNVSHEDARHHEAKALTRLERSDVLRALAKP